MKKYVAGLMFSQNRELVALITKNKPEWQKGLLNGIGGKIEHEDEQFFTQSTKTASESAIVREFQEESRRYQSSTG